MNRKTRRLFYYIFHPLKLWSRHKLKSLEKNGSKLSDIDFINQMFKVRLGYSFNLESPRTINEKINWLKLYDKNPEHTKKVDKYLVREYVKTSIGDEYLIPLNGVWSNPDDIDFNSLPNSFVLKCNHNSGKGGIFICKNKNELTEQDFSLVRKKLQKALKEDYYLFSREWPYKNVSRKIVGEDYIEDSSGNLPDYKFWIFNGKFQMLMICRDRQKDVKMNFYDKNLNFLNFTRAYPNFNNKSLILPNNIGDMIKIAEKLAANDVFVRVDLYNVDGRIYFGEMTYFPGSGFEPFTPRKYDYLIGDMLDLSSLQNPTKKD